MPQCRVFGFKTKGLLYFQSNEIDEDDETDITFSVKRIFAGCEKTFELIPNGSNIKLEEGNKTETLSLIANQQIKDLLDDGKEKLILHLYRCQIERLGLALTLCLRTRLLPW